jgi:hypothetical protein
VTYLLNSASPFIAHSHRSPMATSIAAFYESGTPPPSHPLLTVQTDLTYVSAPVATVTTSEELTLGQCPATHASRSVPNHSADVLPSRSPSLGPSRVQKSRARFRSSSPYVIPAPAPKKVLFSGLKSLKAPESSGSDNDEASTASSEESEGSETSEASETLIPKPQGQVGRPNRGGYKLEVALNWPPPLFSKMQVSVRTLIRSAHLTKPEIRA